MAEAPPPGSNLPDILKVPSTVGLDSEGPDPVYPTQLEMTAPRRKIDLLRPRSGYKKAVLDEASQLVENAGFILPEVPNYYYLVEYGEELIKETGMITDDFLEEGARPNRAHSRAVKIANRNATKFINERIQGETDSLTGLMNRAGFDRQILYMLDDAAETNQPLCLIVGDVNGLKKINDTQGHVKGDKLIQDTGRVLDGKHRNTDLFSMLEARYGGDEFRAVLPRTPLAGAFSWLDETAPEFKEAGISIGLGVVVITPDEIKGKTKEELLKLVEQKSEEADAASYAAKGIAKEQGGSYLLSATHQSAKDQLFEMREARRIKALELAAA